MKENRFSILLPGHRGFFYRHDIHGCPEVWHEKPSLLFINLRCNWIRVSHGCESIWDRAKVND